MPVVIKGFVTFAESNAKALLTACGHQKCIALCEAFAPEKNCRRTHLQIFFLSVYTGTCHVPVSGTKEESPTEVSRYTTFIQIFLPRLLTFLRISLRLIVAV